MRKLSQIFSSTNARVESLRVVVSRIRYSKPIDEVPDSLARVLDLYDRAPIDVNFRQDVHSVLTGGINIAEAMLDPAFDSNQAVAAVSEQITTLSRILNYLSQRPARIGYSILSVSSGTLLGQFSSEGEANQHLHDLKELGHASNAIVVPVKIVSQFSVRPAESTTLPPGFPSVLSTPLTPSELDDMIYETPPTISPPQHDDPALAAGPLPEVAASNDASTFNPPPNKRPPS